MIDIIVENSDDKNELQDDLTTLIKAIKEHPEELVDYINNIIDVTREELVDDGKCPDCGADLEFERDKSMDTYVPYGETSVLYEEGGRMKCPDCGFEKEKLKKQEDIEMTHWKNLASYDYLGAYSLENGKDKIVTIKEIKQELVTGNAGRKENCIVAYFSDAAKPMILNKTNCKTIQKLYNTPNIEEWRGKKITLFASTTSLAGETVECLRIRPYPPVADKPAPKCPNAVAILRR